MIAGGLVGYHPDRHRDERGQTFANATVTVDANPRRRLVGTYAAGASIGNAVPSAQSAPPPAFPPTCSRNSAASSARTTAASTIRAIVVVSGGFESRGGLVARTTARSRSRTAGAVINGDGFFASGWATAGGLVGLNTGSITDLSASGPVTGPPRLSSMLGGLVGLNPAPSRLERPARAELQNFNGLKVLSAVSSDSISARHELAHGADRERDQQ